MPSLFVANWKMNGNLEMLAEWAEGFSPPPNCKTVLCPPLPYLIAARRLLSSQISVGAQCVSHHPKDGAHTGEVAARMLREVGCDYVIVGHSERRAAGETDECCAAQLSAAAAAGLSPILCVGENEKEYDEGKASEVIARQLRALEAFSTSFPPACAVAYEPVWAIGTGKTPSVDELTRAGDEIRLQISQIDGVKGKISVLYGGSITPDNASLLANAGMDGGLVGGASLDAAKFLHICRVGGV